jgi:hypothetical protein
MTHDFSKIFQRFQVPRFSKSLKRIFRVYTGFSRDFQGKLEILILAHKILLVFTIKSSSF